MLSDACVQFWTAKYKNNMEVLKQVQWRQPAAQGMEHWTYEGRLRQLSLLRTQKRWLRGDLIDVCDHLIRRQREDGVKLIQKFTAIG